MAPPSLLGPPELQNQSTTPPPQPHQITAGELPMGLTENMSGTFLSSGNLCLDFFFHVVPDTPSDSIIDRLRLAWLHNPLTTLKLIFNLRGVRGTGKSDKEGFYTSAFWLHQHHPKTLASNIHFLDNFGYIKDLPEILYRLLEGPDVRKIQKDEWKQRKTGKSRKNKSKLSESREIKIVNNEVQRGANIENNSEKVARTERKVAMANKVVQRYRTDPEFRFLYERVSDFFADYLMADMQHLKSGETNKVSLAAKWCPSLDSSFDRSTLLCESIARKVFPQELYPEYEGIEEAHYAYRVRDRLRKEVLVPLRRILELPEVYIGANRWDLIPYNRVASVAMNFYKEKFKKHDGERFSKYLDDVKTGKAKMAAGALLPHQIILALEDDDGGQVAELQWKRMVEDLLQKGKLRNCLAVCDVSGSMSGMPMEVSVALGLLTSELSEEPWKGQLITFSENPTLQEVHGDSLVEKTRFVKEMEWGMNTNFQKVFDLILTVAVNGNLKEDQMIKRLFVFSDMEFDQASLNPWETDYQVIVKKFTEKGFGNVIPEIVFWNLRDSRATPVPGSEKGVALVSGFSKNLMKLFLDGDGVISPEAVMEAAISSEEYQKLVVID
ncbi:hypothetical protein K2173_018894 [Erythroxylum novogranatense]|uniref:Uncharacterized protein n=1 Tax=Erythroxylum novogranatense TaxID=1862640 RepID=A0AAV8SB97_9ROSI|nr:hypothetical protein K2173_018894 [Erythroxylum novogranatense]